MPKVKNYYKILGVSNNAAPEEIERVYQEKVDSLPDDATITKTLKEAYRILTDPEKRTQYDRYVAGLVKTGRLTQVTQSTSTGSNEVPQLSSNGNGGGNLNGTAPASGEVQRWSYLTLEASHNYGTTKYYINGEMDPDLRNVDFSVVINTLGSDGWELVGISTVGTVATYVFKRATNEIYAPPEQGPAA